MVSNDIVLKNPEQKIHTKVCPLCHTELPLFTEGGKHNFCPANAKDGRIIDICIKCKMKEVTDRWSGQDWQKLFPI